MRNKPGKTKSGSPASSERHLGVLLEDMDGKIDLMLEGHAALDHKIDRVAETLNQKIDHVGQTLDNKIDHIDKKLEDFRAEVNERFEQVDRSFEQVDRRFEQVDEQFAAVFDELHVIRNELKEKVGRDEFQLLEKRVSGLEKKLLHAS